MQNNDIQRQQEEVYWRNAHRAVAQAAQDKAAVAQQIFAFQHNFLVPEWLKAILPEEVSSYILNINLEAGDLTLKGTLEETQRLITTILQANDLSDDLTVAIQTSASRFIRLINEIGFNDKESPVVLAKHFVALAMNLNTGHALGMREESIQKMRGALYFSASEQVTSILKHMPEEKISSEILADLYTSAGQLKRWAAHHIQDQQTQIVYATEAVELLDTALIHSQKTKASKKFMAKIKEEQKLAKDFLRTQLEVVFS